MDELKKDFKEMKMEMKTDMEILTQLMADYRKDDLPKEHKLSILYDLEYYLHQVWAKMLDGIMLKIYRETWWHLWIILISNYSMKYDSKENYISCQYFNT